MANITVSVTDANNITVQLTPVAAQNVTIDRGVAGNGISSIVPVTISTLQYLRIYYTNGTQADVGPLTSTAYFGETPITIVGNTISLSTVPINKGGTNATTAAAAIQNLLPSYTGNGSKRLGLNSGATALEWVLDGGGTVTSVDVSGGTTGLTTSGGPITGSGTITLAGTLAVANGGTGVTTSTGTGSVVLSTSPSLVTPLLGTPTSGNFSTGTFTWPTFNQNTTGTAAGLSATLVIASGGTNGTATPTAGAVSYGTGTAYAFTAAGTAGQILQSNGASAPTWANLSTLGVSSFSAGTTGFTPSTGTTGAVTLAGTLNAVNGGTGQSSYAVGDLLYASSTTALSKLADVATGNALISGGVSTAPSWGKIGLTTHVSGTLPTTNGGTGLTSFSANGVVYASSTSALATGSALTFDGTTFTAGTATGQNGVFKTVIGSGGANEGVVIVSGTTGTGWLGFNNGNNANIPGQVTYNHSTGALSLYANAGPVIFSASGAEGMRLTSTSLYTASGINVGIGTSSPAGKLTVDPGNTSGTQIDGLRLPKNFTAQANFVAWQQGANGWRVGIPYGDNTYPLAFYYGASTPTASSPGTQLMTLDASGNLGLGVTPSAWGGAYKAIEFPGISLANLNGGTNQQAQYLLNAYDSSAGAWKYKITGAGAAMYRQSADGSHEWHRAASGTAGNAITFTQAMTLDASGNLGVGTTSPATKFNVSDTSTNCTITVTNSASNFQVQSNSNDGYFNLNGSGNIIFRSGTPSVTERARIDSSGNLLVGTTNLLRTTDGYTFSINAGSISGNTNAQAIANVTSNTYSCWDMYSRAASAYRFYVGWGGTVYATSTTISAISDQRLKENIRDLDDGLASVMALKPRKFDWKEGKGANIKDARGFIAQEFETVFPDMIDEWRDPAPEGEEPYKAINANLIPTLVKAIQEQQAIIQSLTARITALEGA